MNRVGLLTAIAIVLVIGTLAIPVKQACGAPGYTCSTGVDTQGYVHSYYEIEPLGVYLVETVTGSNIRIYYKSGEDREKVR
jgi:hypothetical protein